jgi:hypothetical protein
MQAKMEVQRAEMLSRQDNYNQQALTTPFTNALVQNLIKVQNHGINHPLANH